MLDGLMPSSLQRESLTARAKKYHEHLQDLAGYLEGRGIGEQVALTNRLGCVAEPAPGDERFTGMLCIPYLTARGDVIALKFRRITGEGAKYDGPSGQKQHLYNARALVTGGEVAVICEGELDTLMAAQTFGVPCVGTPGTNWLPHWSRCFGDFDRVVVIADNDEKDDGSNPGRKHALNVQKHVPGSDVIYPPPGHDLSSWVQEFGVDAVRSAVNV